MHNISEKKARSFAKKIANFYDYCGRKDLPWRKTRDPWKILLAELLLRKTSAQQVEPIYRQLSELSPLELAALDRTVLEDYLRPIGIYRERARLISSAAGQAAQQGESLFQDENKLSMIAGVGPYAVNAVQCFAYGKPKPALDRNMIRVLERVFSLKSEKVRPHTDRDLWRAAEGIVPKDEPEKYNWGVLDLSAALCRPRNPICVECPINNICDYGMSQIAGSKSLSQQNRTET